MTETATESWDHAWASALDELELAVADAERQLADAHRAAPVAAAPWRPPAGLGPMPASLEARARALLGRQLETARSLAAAATRSRRQLRISDAMSPPTPHPPVYVDLDG